MERSNEVSAGIARDQAFELRLTRARIEAVSKQRLMAFVWNIVISTVCVAFLWSQHSHTQLFGWWGCNFIFNLWRIRDWYLSQKVSPATLEYARSWLRKITIASAIGGVIWGIGAWFFIDTKSIPIMVFFLLTLLSVANGAVISYAAHLPAGLAFATPIALLSAVSLFYSDFSHGWLIALGSIVALGFMIAVARNYAITVTSALTLHVENLALLAVANQQKRIAETANQDKSRFFASISHDLRQPLYAMGLVLESLGERLRDEELKILHSDLAKMHDALTEMFSAALDVSRLDSGSVQVNLTNFELNDVLSALCSEFSQEAEKKHITLDFQQSPCWLHTDRLLFMRIVRNLISNAVKFNHDGYVNVRTEENTETVEIEIEDDGHGIPKDAQDKIFAEYYQAHNEARLRTEGLGIGLAVVQRLCRLLGITIAFESVPEDGTTFRLIVPKGKPDSKTKILEPPIFHRFGGLHVLLVDDDPVIQSSLQRLLLDHECTVTIAAGSAEALDKISAKTRPVDVLLCDYRLGENTDGFTEIARIRSELDPQLPAILITGDTAPEIGQRAQADNLPILLKPIKPNVLFQAILAEI